MKKRPRRFSLWMTALILSFVFFFAMIVFFILSGRSPNGRIFTTIRYDGAAFLCFGAFGLFMLLFGGLLSLQNKIDSKRAERIKLTGKVFVCGRMVARSTDNPAAHIRDLIPAGMLAEKEEEADWVLDVFWSQEQVGHYGSSSYSAPAYQSTCRIRFLDCNSGRKRMRIAGEKIFSTTPPDKILVGHGFKPRSVGGFPYYGIEAFIKSLLPQKA